MDRSRFDTLSPRERECLRLVFDRKTSKEIGRLLGISKDTADGYVAEAVIKVGGRNRRDAAELLAAHEGAPRFVGGDPARLDPVLPGAPMPPSPGTAIDWRSLLPIRRKGAAHNPLSMGLRLAWIPILAMAILFAFGAAVGGLSMLGDIVVVVARSLRS